MKGGGGVWSYLADRRVASLFFWGNLASNSEIELLGVGEENVQCIYMEHKIIPLLGTLLKTKLLSINMFHFQCRNKFISTN